MGGEGSMQHMITTLRNNSNMLRRKGMFQRKRSFRSIKREYQIASKGINTSKKLSKEALLHIRNKVIENRRRENMKAFIILFIIIVSIILLVVYMIN
jgi:hypothetical protein